MHHYPWCLGLRPRPCPISCRQNIYFCLIRRLVRQKYHILSPLHNKEHSSVHQISLFREACREPTRGIYRLTKNWARRTRLGDIIPPKTRKRLQSPRKRDTSSHCSKLSSTYVSLACTDFQQPYRWKTLSFTPLFAIVMASPDLRECKPNLDGSTPRLCRSQRKAPLIVE